MIDDPFRLRPRAALVRLAFAEVEQSGGKLEFYDATIKVMKVNPELAERYQHMPGVKDA